MHDDIDEESHINDLSKGYYYLSAKLPLALIQPGAKKYPVTVNLLNFIS